MMDHIAYDLWASYIHEKFSDLDVQKEDRILEIACGTGTILKKLKDQYPHIIGLDISKEMLFQASNKVDDILLQANMIHLPFVSDSIHAVYCNHDSVNYLNTIEILKHHFSEIHRILKKRGIYIFDISSEKNVIQNYHNKKFYKKTNDISIVWDNYYQFDEKIITSIIRLEDHLGNKMSRELFRESGSEKIMETHLQRIYTEEELLKVFDEYDFSILSTEWDYKKDERSDEGDLIVYTIQKRN